MKLKVLPVFNGDSFLISFSFDGQVRNFLIDGGIPRAYKRTLKFELENILNLEQNIDLLVITHIDDDHIGGIKEFYQDSSIDRSFVKKIWFNSGKLLYRYFNEKEKEDRDVDIIGDETTLMSIAQGMTLEKILLKEGQWQPEIIHVGKPSEILHGAKITILSPSDKQLQKLHAKWEVEIDTDVKMSGNNHDDFIEPISELIKKEFIEDKAIPNSSSIALLLEIDDKKVLLLADSHPSVIVSTLKELGYSNKCKLNVDVTKISHHGSKGNTSPELLSMIQCNKFIICTDGNKHGLPDKESIARIIEFNPECTIYFNYDDFTKEIFLPIDVETYKFSYKLLSEIDYTLVL